MTSHFMNHEWKLTDELTPEIKDEIKFCVDMNLKIGSSVFAILCEGDNVIYILGSLSGHREDPKRLRQEVEYTADSSPHPENFRAIAEHVFPELKDEQEVEAPAT